MKTLIEMAKESGFTADEFAWHDHMFERFAELVRADAIADEREACAYRAGIALLGADRGLTNRVDQAIRARSEQ